MTVFAPANELRHDVLAKFVAESKSELRGSNHLVRMTCRNGDDRTSVRQRAVTGTRARTRKVARSGKSDLVVAAEMKRTANVVTGDVLHVEYFVVVT